MRAIPIWSPRYWDKKVLIATTSVKKDKCYMFFCCDRNKLDLYSFDGKRVIEECSVCSNGKIPCFEVPLEWLENEGDLPKEYEEIRKVEYAKFLKRKKK